MFIDYDCDTEEDSESPNIFNVNNPHGMGLWWIEGYDFVQSITQIQIFASQKVGQWHPSLSTIQIWYQC